METASTTDLFGFVRRAGSEQSRARVLAELSRLIGDRLSANRVTVYALEDEGLVPLVSEYSSGQTDIPRFATFRGTRVLAKSKLAAQLSGGADLLLIDDPKRVLPGRIVEALGIEPFLAAALRSESRLHGALIVEGNYDELTTRQDEIRTLAAVVTLTLQTSQTAKRARERSRETEALLEVGAVLTESTSVTEVLAAVAGNSARICGFERCSILTLDETGELVPVMSQFADGHVDSDLWEQFRVTRKDLPAARQVIESGEPAIFREPESVPDLIPPGWIEPFGIKSMLLVPLVAWEERFGVLVLDHRERHTIGPDRIRIAMAVAAQGAAAIGISRLLEREGQSRLRAEETSRDLRAREAQQAAVARVSQVALTAPDLKTLMDEAVRVLATILDVACVKVLELQPDGQEFLLASGVGWHDGLVGTTMIEAGDGSQAGYTLSASSPVIVEDLDSEQRFSGPDLLIDHGIVSGVSVVIGGREKPYGVLGIHTTVPHEFTTEDVDFLQSTANVLASAVERDLGEKAVLESEERLQAILDSASDAIISVDEDRKIVLFNQYACDTFGYTPEEALGQNLGMLLPAFAGKRHLGHVEDFFAERGVNRTMSERVDLAGRRKDGSEFPTEITISRTARGGQTIFTAIIRDVTERTVAQALIRESEERHRSLFERSPIAIWEQDFSAVGAWLDGLRASGVTDLRSHLTAHPDEVDHGIGLIDVLSVNPAGVALIGAKSLDELIESRSEPLQPSGIRGSFITQFTTIWEHSDRVQFELVTKTASGSRLDCDFHFVASRTDDLIDLSRVIVALADITERKAAEEQLKELVRSKDELIASVSHEIRTPLTAILGSAELLNATDAGLTENEKGELLDVLANESSDVANIVEDLIVAAKADIEKLYVMRVPIDLRTQAAQALEGWGPKTRENIALSDGTAHCVGDPARVRQIIRNLVSNAIRYGGENIRVGFDHHGSRGCVYLADDGAGVPHDDVERIFENYQRGSQAPGLTAALGLGLGLSRHLARVMDGDVTYRREGSETVFELCLPLANAEE
jgi:PAS domain S-box-containing protein